MKQNKKAISAVIALILLLLVTVSAGAGLYSWFSSFQSDVSAKNELKGNVGKLTILGIERYDDSSTLIGIRNVGSSYHILNTIKINNNDCTLMSGNVIEKNLMKKIYVNCSVNVGSNYNIDIYSDKGIYSKTFTVYQ